MAFLSIGCKTSGYTDEKKGQTIPGLELAVGAPAHTYMLMGLAWGLVALMGLGVLGAKSDLGTSLQSGSPVLQLVRHSGLSVGHCHPIRRRLAVLYASHAPTDGHATRPMEARIRRPRRLCEREEDDSRRKRLGFDHDRHRRRGDLDLFKCPGHPTVLFPGGQSAVG